MNEKKSHVGRWWYQWCRLALLCSVVIGFCGCSLLSVISDFDQDSLNQMQLVQKKIDFMFTTLQFSDKSERQFSKFKNMYIDISVEINALKSMQLVRSMNDLTNQQVDTLIKLWQQEHQAHKQKDGMSDIIINLHRSQYRRLMMAIIKGEEAKPQEN